MYLSLILKRGFMASRMSGPASLTSQAACRVAAMRRPEREEEDFFRSLGNISHRVKELIAPFFQLGNLNEILEMLRLKPLSWPKKILEKKCTVLSTVVIESLLITLLQSRTLS